MSATRPTTIDRDSILWSKERYRIIAQPLPAGVAQFLVIDTFENEIVGTHAAWRAAFDQRNALDPI